MDIIDFDGHTRLFSKTCLFYMREKLLFDMKVTHFETKSRKGLSF